MKKMILILLVVVALILLPCLFYLAIQPDSATQQNGLYSEISQLKGDPQERIILENRKIFQEGRRLEKENNQFERGFEKVVKILSLLTGIAAFIGAVIAVRKYFSDQKKEVEQNKRDNQQRFEEKFVDIIEKFSSESVSSQASAVASLLAVIHPRNREYCDAILAVLIVNLKEEINRKPVILDFLTRALEKNLSLMLSTESNKNVNEKDSTLNLSRTVLIRPNFENLNFDGFEEVDVAFADLTLANLKDTKLNRLRGREVILNNAKLSRAELKEARLNKAQCEGAHFHESILISATLKGANLRKAEFMEAQLQAAHLEGSDITGAKFEKADINDTYFNEVILDDFAKKSLIKAKNWQKAHFDKSLKQELDILESKKHQTVEEKQEG